MSRQPLSRCMPEATSLERAAAFNKTTVGKFFDKLAEVMDRYKFPPHMIYNVDQTGVITVPKPTQVVALKGEKQESAEGGELVTVVCAVNAMGNAVPPMVILPRDRYKEHFIIGVPIGSICASSRSGRINDTFVEFLEHLAQHTNSSSDHPMLLIFDNHKAPISQRALDLAKRKGNVMLTIPLHTSRHLQPLDISSGLSWYSVYNGVEWKFLSDPKLLTGSIYSAAHEYWNPC